MNALWLLDLEKFNEWMNEEDYLVEEEATAGVCIIVCFSLVSLYLFISKLQRINQYLKFCNFQHHFFSFAQALTCLCVKFDCLVQTLPEQHSKMDNFIPHYLLFVHLYK